MTEKNTVCNLCPFARLASFFRDSEAGKHLIGAKREVLLSIRSVIDQEIKRLEKKTDMETAQKVDIQ